MLTVNGTSTVLSSTTVPSMQVVANDTLRVRFQVSCSPTTTVRAKVWRSGATEPVNWLTTSTGATPTALRQPGQLGILLYLSGSWTGTPATLAVDNLYAGPPG